MTTLEAVFFGIVMVIFTLGVFASLHLAYLNEKLRVDILNEEIRYYAELPGKIRPLTEILRPHYGKLAISTILLLICLSRKK